jgi:hypothetical protein
MTAIESHANCERRATASTSQQAGSALVVALFALALAGSMAAMFADLARTTLVRARVDRDGADAWFLAEAGLADTVGAMEAGGSFTATLTARPGTSRPAPGGYVADVVDDVDETPNDATLDKNERVLVRVTAAGRPPVRRRLEAVIMRAPAPFLPGAATLTGGVRDLTGDFRLDGRDASMESGCTMEGRGPSRAGLSIPPDADAPALDRPEHVSGIGTSPSLTRRIPPDLTAVATTPSAVRVSPGVIAGDLGTTSTPQLTVVTGDAIVSGTASGAGVLYAAGELQISGTLRYTGVVAAARGVRVLNTGELHVCGALWAGGEPALEARGRGDVHASTDAIAWAARVAPLPARARIAAARELF